jgi:hypothetical protein
MHTSATSISFLPCVKQISSWINAAEKYSTPTAFSRSFGCRSLLGGGGGEQCLGADTKSHTDGRTDR